MKYHISVFHNIANGPRVNVLVNGEMLRKKNNPNDKKIDFGEAFDFKTKNSKIHIEVKLDDLEIISRHISLEKHHKHQHYTIIIDGSISDKSSLVIYPISGHMGEGRAAKARFFHGIYGAPNVDVYVNDKIAVTNLSYGRHTDFIELNPESGIILALTPSGSQERIYISDVNASLKPVSGKNHDFIIGGLLGNTDDKFEPQLRAVLY